MAKKSRATEVVDTASAAAPAAGPSRFKTSVVLGAMLFAPAAFLVFRGNLSVNEALVRFACALLFAMVGTAIVMASLPAEGHVRAAGAEPGEAPSTAADQSGSTVGVPAVPVTQPVG